MVVHIVHRTAARRSDRGCSLAPGDEGLINSSEMLPVFETIHRVHEDLGTADNECAALNKAASEQQRADYGEVLDELIWSVTSIGVEKAGAAPEPGATV